MSDGGARPEPSALATILRYSSLGLEMGTAVGIGLLLGWWLDGHFDSSPWGLLSGLMLGFASAVMMIWRSVSALQRAEQDAADGPQDDAR